MKQVAWCLSGILLAAAANGANAEVSGKRVEYSGNNVASFEAHTLYPRVVSGGSLVKEIFRNDSAEYTFTLTGGGNNGAGGIANGVVGSLSNNTSDIIMPSVSDNTFDHVSITLHGYRDTHYLAGGGIVGLRATGEQSASSASTIMNTVSGNTFTNVTVVTDQAKNAPSGAHLGSAYIEGGGVIGVDAVSSPANKPGLALIGSLTNNRFSAVTVRSGDILLGGGIVGVNNNSRLNTASDNLSPNAASRIIDASGNIFENSSVTTGYSMRGGGIIGINGLSVAAASLGSLTDNSFTNLSVSSTQSYIKGGGIVGLNNAFPDETDIDKIFEDKSTIPSGIYNSVFLDNAARNTFRGINVSTGSYLYGGGVIGVHSGNAVASLFTLENNTFRQVAVTVGGNDGASNPVALKGGGVIGVSSAELAAAGSGCSGGASACNGIAGVSGNIFEDISVSTGAGRLLGGGIIGVQADEVKSGMSFAVLDTVANNTFDRLRVTVGGQLEGGGVIGASTQSGVTGFGGSPDNDSEGIVNNRFSNIAVNAVNIQGGGLIGVSTNVSDALNTATIHTLAGNSFSGNTVRTSGHISGGGLVGVSSGGAAGGSGAQPIASMEKITANTFTGNTVETGSYLDGGGIIGATAPTKSAAGKTPTVNIRLIADSVFSGNTVTTGGDLLGGLVYSYGLAGGMEIRDSVFSGNRFTVNGNFYGALTVDTGTDANAHANTNKAGDPIEHWLTLRATSGKKTVFQDNTLGGNTAPSLYMGTVKDPGAGRDDEAAAAARLTIWAESGGEVALYDPIRIDQDADFGFNMDVIGPGKFLWGGANTAKLSAGAPGGTITLANTIDAILLQHQSFNKNAPASPFDFNAYPDTTLTFMGNNVLTVRQARLYGSNHFNLAATRLYKWEDGTGAGKGLPGSNAPRDTTDDPVLSFQGDSSVDITGARITLDNAPAKLNIQPGDRFYLIQTAAPGNLTGAPATYSVNLQSGLLTEYTLVIDKANPDEGGPGKGFYYLGDEKNDRQYLVARLQSEPPAPQVDPNPPEHRPYMPSSDTPPERPDTPAHPPIDPRSAPPVRLNPKGKVFLEGRAAALAILSRRGSWVVDHSYQSADLGFFDCQSVCDEDGNCRENPEPQPGQNWCASGKVEGWRKSTFAGLDASRFRANTGSHIDITGAAMVAGLAVRHKKEDRSVLLGGFIEAHHADYDTDNSITGSSGKIDRIEGDGKFRAAGIGLMSRLAWAKQNTDYRDRENTFRIEASLRYGRAHNEWKTSHFFGKTQDGTQVNAKYDYSVPYLGAHAGLGYEHALNEHDTLDIVGRYYWLRQSGKTEALSSGERLRFEMDDSHRIRIGGRFTREKDKYRSWYAGLYAEREMAGKPKARFPELCDSHNVDCSFESPDLKGTTGIVELGIRGHSRRNTRFSWETGLQGYFGRIKGVSAGVRLDWQF